MKFFASNPLVSSFLLLLVVLHYASLLPTSLVSAFHHHHVPLRPMSTLSSSTTSVSTTGGPSSELIDKFNAQVTNEMAASQLYLAASIWFDQRDWEGFASYMLGESAEERDHALQFVAFGNKRNIPLKLQTIPSPALYAVDWKDPEDVWKSVLELERRNTVNLLHLAEEAQKCYDYAILAFLNPFHLEQVESEDKVGNILAKVTDENRTPGLLRSLDHELGLDGK